MDGIELGWTFWFAVGGAVTVVAAALLVAILLVARGIEKEAARALRAAERIRGNTQAIWTLGPALELTRRIRDLVEAVEAKAAALAGTVHEPGGSARKEEA